MKFTGKKTVNLHQLLAPIKETGNWDSSNKQLYYLQGEDGLNVGPVDGQKLLSFLEYTPLPSSTQIKPLGDQAEWILLYEHPIFQRRKPQVVTDHGELVDKNFWLLKAGQKEGPFTFHELKDKVSNQEFLINQLVSYDDGEHWYKLYELEDFDRRKKTSQLPSHPAHESIKSSTLKKVKNLTDHVDEGQKRADALATLAISHQNKLKKRKASANIHQISKPQVSTEHFQGTATTQTQPVEVSNFKYGLIMSLSIIGILYLLFTSDDRESYRNLAGMDEKKTKLEKLKDAGENIKENAEDLLEKNEEKQTPAQVVKIPKKTQDKQTFKESIYNQNQAQVRQMQREPVEQYREIAQEDAPYPNDEGYPKDSYMEQDNYDQLVKEDETLVEQDPVKSQVSRETLNDYDEVSEPDSYPAEESYDDGYDSEQY